MKLFSRRSAGLVAAAACWLTPSVVNAEIVVNGGFETGSFFPWSAPPFVPLGQPNPQYFSVGFNSGHNGGRYAVMSSTLIRYIDQLLPTEAGQDYELSFWLRRPSSTGSRFYVRWEGATIFNQTVELPDSTNWHQFTFPLHSTFNGSLLELGQATFPLEFHIDDVSVVAVPAPGAAAVLVVAGAVAARRRRR